MPGWCSRGWLERGRRGARSQAFTGGGFGVYLLLCYADLKVQRQEGDVFLHVVICPALLPAATWLTAPTCCCSWTWGARSSACCPCRCVPACLLRQRGGTGNDAVYYHDLQRAPTMPK